MRLAFVDEEVGMMSSSFAEHVHHARKRGIRARSHIKRLYREPGGIDSDHLMSSLSSSAHSLAADAGHSMLTLRPLRRTSTRIGPSVGLTGIGSGTKLSGLSVAMTGTVRWIAIGARLPSAAATQRRSKLAFTPRARATAAIDTPSCWHAPTASALNSSLWRRRRRRPVEITPLMDTCTPPR
jgi:hypothetical protein